MGRKEKHRREDGRDDPLRKGMIRDYWETICVVLIFVLFARTWVFQNSNIPSGSMKNTLLVGDRLLVNLFIYGPVDFKWERKILPMQTVHRGDIVVFKYPGRPEVPFIKRVIAKGGDVVEVIDNHVFVNGRMLVEGYTRLPDYIKTTYIQPPKLPPRNQIPVLPDYLKDPSAFVVQTMPGRTDVTLKGMYENGDPSREKFGPYIIPKGHLFVMGDNRLNSEDSRFWGALDEKLVLGRAWVIWWSFKDHEQGFRPSSPGTELKRLGNKVIHFFSRTRWRRILMRPH